MRDNIPGRARSMCPEVETGVRKVSEGAKCTVTGVLGQVTMRSVSQAGTDHGGQD